MEQDKKSLKILKKYCTWKKESITEEELAYAIEKGVMYKPLTMGHSEVIYEIRERANDISMEEAVKAFLYSLSTGDYRYRTILSSVIWGRSVPDHDLYVRKKYDGTDYCIACNYQLKRGSAEGQQNLNGYKRYLTYGGEQDICEAGYVFFDLRQYEKLPKVEYKEEDIKILNRIFGLVEELGPANKVVALQKLIMAEKFFKATKNEISSILGVLSICGVFDTPEHKSVSTEFISNGKRRFEMECDLYYPLNFWRGKHGVNYSAVENIFAPVVGDALDSYHTIRGEVKRQKIKKEKKSKAEEFFVEGEHFIDLTNDERYYYGLQPLKEEWDKVTKYSVTYQVYKRTEIYFEGDKIKKIIYEEKHGPEKVNCSYLEADMDAETEGRELVLPKTSRGRKQPLRPTLLMTPTYMREHLMVVMTEDGKRSDISCFNASNDQYLPVPLGYFRNKGEFIEYTGAYIEDLPDDYDRVIKNFHEKKRRTVDIHAGAVFRVQLTPRLYTYGLILGRVREMLKWKEIPEDHPLQNPMAQPIMFRQYDIFTENGNMKPEDFQGIPLMEMDVCQDNFILWETYPIIGYKKLVESDIDLGFSVYKNKVTFGFASCEINREELADIEDLLSHTVFNYGTSLYMQISYGKTEENDHRDRLRKIRKFLEEKFELEPEKSMDDFAKRYGGITRKQFIQLAEERKL